MSSARVIVGDCREVMAGMDAQSVDAIVCDPPYDLTSGTGRGFMGKAWDGTGVAFDPTTWTEALRVIKPGGHLLAFGGTRTYHRLVCAVEEAGWEIRDTIAWHYGSGFPKSLDVSKAIDKAAGAEREVLRERYTVKRIKPGATVVAEGAWGKQDVPYTATDSAPATDDARTWEGWGTALKPSTELIVVARAPLSERNVAANVLRHGTAALNIDACRVGTGEGDHESESGAEFVASMRGRWPANVVLSHSAECREIGTREVSRRLIESTSTLPSRGVYGEGLHGSKSLGETTETIPAWECVEGCPVVELDAQSGQSTSSKGAPRTGRSGEGWGMTATGAEYSDSGGASRFFYTAKATTAERLLGLTSRNPHPTVKPVELMSWLCRLVTPPGGVILDPFLGSGTTAVAALGCGFACIGIEQSPEYAEIAVQRIGMFGTIEAAS